MEVEIALVLRLAHVVPTLVGVLLVRDPRLGAGILSEEEPALSESSIKPLRLVPAADCPPCFRFSEMSCLYRLMVSFCRLF